MLQNADVNGAVHMLFTIIIIIIIPVTFVYA